LVAAAGERSRAASGNGGGARLGREGSEVGIVQHADVVLAAGVAAAVGDARTAAVDDGRAGLERSHPHIANSGLSALIASLAACREMLGITAAAAASTDEERAVSGVHLSLGLGFNLLETRALGAASVDDGTAADSDVGVAAVIVAASVN